MEFKAKIGTVKDFLGILLGVVSGFALVIITAVISGEDMSKNFFALIITALVVAVVTIGTISIMRAKVKYFIILSETSLTIRYSRFPPNSIPYENIISFKTNKYNEIKLKYRIKGKRSYTYQFTTEKQDEFFSQLQTYVNKISA